MKVALTNLRIIFNLSITKHYISWVVLKLWYINVATSQTKRISCDDFAILKFVVILNGYIFVLFFIWERVGTWSGVIKIVFVFCYF